MKHKLSAIIAILLFAMPVKAQQVLRDAFTDEIDRLSIHYWQMLESTYWTDVTEELDEQWANEWKTAPEPQILTREQYEQMMKK